MPGRNCTCYNYLLLILFVCLFVCSRWYYLVWELFLRFDYSFSSTSDPRQNSPSDESRTHFRLFIKTFRLSRWVNLELCLDFLPLGFATKLTTYR